MKDADRRKQEEATDPKSLLDVVEEEFPDKVGGLFGGLSRIGQMFTVEDWLKILTRSRSNYEESWKRKKDPR